jgi:hypothetical protein
VEPPLDCGSVTLNQRGNLLIRALIALSVPVRRVRPTALIPFSQVSRVHIRADPGGSAR